ncbi:MAG: polysaccharide deacetylase family protein [Oscillibacter sp.]|nr:polysaccharide deacetylase family protein [Oscillibacter sp.]
MNSLSLALVLSALLSVSPPAFPPPLPAVSPPEPAAQVQETPMVQATSRPEEPAAYAAKLPVLMYHHVVCDGEACNDMTVTVGRLEEDLHWLAENGYHTVLPRELAAAQPLPEKPVLITFDDGYRSNYDLAFPLLQKYSAKAAIALMVYMPDKNAENFLSWDMCRQMTASGLVEIGSHGFAIHNLDERMGNFVPGQANGVQRRKGESDLDFQCRVLDDLRYSYDRIAVELGAAPSFFAYPFGKTDPGADAFLQELFPLTVVTGPGKYAADLSGGLHGLPRFTITMKAAPETFLKRG